MISIRELEEHFGKDFETIIKNNDIVYIADNVKSAVKDYIDYELNRYEHYVNIDTITDMVIWLNDATKDDLFDNELDAHERYFKVVENGNIYYLNSVDFC